MIYVLKNKVTGQYYDSYLGYVDDASKAKSFVSRKNAEDRIREYQRGKCYFRESNADIPNLVAVACVVVEIPEDVSED